MTRPNPIVSVMIVILSLALLTGCVKSLNTEVPIIQPVSIVEQSQAERSVTTLNRDHWDVLSVAPVSGGVEHEPIYVTHIRLVEEHPRATGVYPTVDSVVGVHDDDFALTMEPVAGYPWAALEFIIGPVQIMLGRFPWNVETSPETSYDRIPVDNIEQSHTRYGVRPVE